MENSVNIMTLECLNFVTIIITNDDFLIPLKSSKVNIHTYGLRDITQFHTRFDFFVRLRTIV